jgi:hypothetical protein
MWLKKLVGFVLIVTCISMNVLVFVGLFSVDKTLQKTVDTTKTVAITDKPTVTLSVNPTTISANTTSALSWTTTGNPSTCTASGSWSGVKTAFGAESTGRVPTPGTYTYTLTCTASTETATSSAILTVGEAAKPGAPAPASSPSPSPTAQGPTYCGGRLPCYGSGEVASHGSAGNCWGWNGDRVIDISSLNASFHQTKSGISTIEVSGVCGKDLASVLSGAVSAEGQTRNHNQATKNNADRNMIPYFVGYYDSSK